MFNLPTPLDVVVFENSGSWTLPNKARMVYWWGCGAGGGGGGGCSGAADTQRGGGAGGTGANIGWGFAPSVLFPDNIYIGIPRGGAGGGPDQNGTSGSALFVSRESLNAGGNAQFVLLNIAGGMAGSRGTTTAGGTANNTGSTLNTIGLDISTNALTGTGTSGGLTGNGSTLSGTNGVLITPGTGGGGCPVPFATTRGGPLFNNEASNSLLGGAGNTTTNGENGRNGETQWLEKQPFVSLMRAYGGLGGGNSNTATGGNGGNGGYGSGGGGGGGGFVGGTGGNGGQGVLIIAYW